MAAFPYYNSGDIDGRWNAQAEAILELFARARLCPRRTVGAAAGRYLPGPFGRGNPPPHLHPDRSVRPRLCLRPDLTIPICHQAVKEGAKFPARICYNGLVFRHQPAEPHRPTQFFQAGAELLGLADRAAGETEIMALTVEALRAAGLKDFSVKIGDLALFGALVDALDVPAQWRARLKRHFWRAGYFEALLGRMTQGAASDAQRLLGSLGGLTESESRAAIEGLMDLVADAPQGARTREEIVERLMEQAADAAALRLDPKIADVITRLLAVSGTGASRRWRKSAP